MFSTTSPPRHKSIKGCLREARDLKDNAKRDHGARGPQETPKARSPRDHQKIAHDDSNQNEISRRASRKPTGRERKRATDPRRPARGRGHYHESSPANESTICAKDKETVIKICETCNLMMQPKE